MFVRKYSDFKKCKGSHKITCNSSQATSQSFSQTGENYDNTDSSNSNENTHVPERNSQSPPGSMNNRNNITEVTVEKVKCFYTNADQLRNKLDELQIQISLEEPDFIFVTKVLPKTVSDLEIVLLYCIKLKITRLFQAQVKGKV